MTEQEKREKEIEMGRHLCPKFEIYCSDCGEDCNIADHCSLLIDAGYRKDEEVRKECDKNAYYAWKGMFGVKEKAIREEVRKETAKEFANALLEAMRNSKAARTEIRIIAKVLFGVEVE